MIQRLISKVIVYHEEKRLRREIQILRRKIDVARVDCFIDEDLRQDLILYFLKRIKYCDDQIASITKKDIDRARYRSICLN